MSGVPEAVRKPAPCIASVTARVDIGDAERHLARILPALRWRGIDVVLHVMEREGPLEAELGVQGVRIKGAWRARLLHWPSATAAAGFLRRERLPGVVEWFAFAMPQRKRASDAGL
jgi:hypothetical protein